MTGEKRRTLLLGLWGLRPSRLLAGAHAGELPFLRGFLEEGVRGPLEPSPPYYFSVAWANWLSGHQPGRHGHFGKVSKFEVKAPRQTPLASTLVSLMADAGQRSAFFNLPSSLPLSPGRGQEIFSRKMEGRESNLQKIERWGETFRSLWERQPWDFLAAAIDFAEPPGETPDESSLLSLVKLWENNLHKTLAPHEHELNILVLTSALPLKPKNFSLEKILEAKGFLRKKGKKIDPASSRAYPAGELEIKVNLKGREPQGRVEPGREYEALRDKIIQELLPEYNQPGVPPGLKIHKKEELFSGEFLEQAPDLLLDFEEGKNQGFFMAKGSPFAQAREIGPVRGIDIAPTILYLRGQEVPSLMEGRIVKEALSEDFWRLNPPRLMTETAAQKTPPTVSAEKLERIIERLKGLGYLT